MDRALRPSLIIAALGGLILRIWVLASPAGALDADEAVVVLMAEGFTSFEPQVFYWGQHYGGSLDALVTAPLFFVTGTSVLAAKLVMVVMHAAACWLVWRIGRRIFDDQVGLVAAATAWVASPAIIWWSTKTRGFYGSGVVVAMAVVLFVVRLTDREPDPDEDRRDLVAVGVAAGVAWWVSPITLFVVVPAVAAGLVLRRDLWTRLWIPVGPFVLGSLPWWLYNVSRGFPSLEQPPPSVESTFAGRLEGFVGQLIPMLLGFRRIFSAEWYGGVAGQALAVVIIGGLVVAAVRFRHRSWIPLAVLVGYPIVAAVASATHYVEEPRYGYLLAPTVALVAAGVAGLDRRTLVALPVVVLVLTTLGVAGLIDRTGDERFNLVLDPPEVEPLETAMQELGIEYAYGEYWLAYRVTAETDLTVTPMVFVRDFDLHGEVIESGTEARVFYLGSELAWDYKFGLGYDDIAYEVIELDGFEIVVPER
ncbi:MAG: glycosyltransferase family 39 protein [Actinomycetota bacterium]